MGSSHRTAKWKRARIAALIARDGSSCWLCTLPVALNATRPGRRASLEHLLARSLGGKDDLDNLVLCHAACNRHLGQRPVAQKLAMRAKWHRTATQRRVDRKASTAPGRGRAATDGWADAASGDGRA